MGKEAPREPDRIQSDILKDPSSIVNAARFIVDNPEDKGAKEFFKNWLQEEWKKINQLLMKTDFEKQYGNRRVVPLCAKDNHVRYLGESHSDFEFLQGEGIDRLRAEMKFQTGANEKQGNHCIEIKFIADSKTRDNLLGLIVESRDLNKERSTKNEEEKRTSMVFEISTIENLKIEQYKLVRAI
jgi:hypothetical protein